MDIVRGATRCREDPPAQCHARHVPMGGFPACPGAVTVTATATGTGTDTGTGTGTVTVSATRVTFPPEPPQVEASRRE
jgi:hypothetical protein